jgi:hypothetical protein
MTKKHHMDQNPYISYVQNQGCSQTIWHEGMIWHKARAQPTQSLKFDRVRDANSDRANSHVPLLYQDLGLSDTHDTISEWVIYQS